MSSVSAAAAAGGGSDFLTVYTLTIPANAVAPHWLNG